MASSAGEAMNKQVTLFEMASSIINADNVFLPER